MVSTVCAVAFGIPWKRVGAAHDPTNRAAFEIYVFVPISRCRMTEDMVNKSTQKRHPLSAQREELDFRLLLW